MKQCLLNLCHGMDHSTIDNAVDKWRGHLLFFMHVCGQMVYTLAAIELLNSICSLLNMTLLCFCLCGL